MSGETRGWPFRSMGRVDGEEEAKPRSMSGRPVKQDFGHGWGRFRRSVVGEEVLEGRALAVRMRSRVDSGKGRRRGRGLARIGKTGQGVRRAEQEQEKELKRTKGEGWFVGVELADSQEAREKREGRGSTA
ncbi:hypothetical protein ACQY0O_004303 [Thecaphora frezii]